MRLFWAESRIVDVKLDNVPRASAVYLPCMRMRTDMEEETINSRFNVLRRLHLWIGLLAICFFLLGGIFLLSTHVESGRAMAPGILLPDKNFIAAIATANPDALEVYEAPFAVSERLVSLVSLVGYLAVPLCIFAILLAPARRRGLAGMILGAALLLQIGIGWQQRLQREPIVFATPEAVSSSDILLSNRNGIGSYRRDALNFVEAQLLWNDGQHAAASELASAIETGWFDDLGSIGDDRLHLIAGRASSMRPVILPLGIRLDASSITPLRIAGWTLLGCAMAVMTLLVVAGRSAHIRKRDMVSRLQRVGQSRARLSFSAPQGILAA